MSKILLLISCLLFIPSAIAAGMETPRWSYDGERDGQENWGMLSHLYASCELGHEQSPINITSTKMSYKPALEFAYKETNASVKFEDLALVVVIDDAAMLSSEAKNYKLEQIMFHSPGEHTVSKDFYPLEIQFMHRDAEGNRFILAVFAKLGEANTTIGKMLASPSLRFDPSDLLPQSHSYYAYRGSLTTPPCTEGVEWRILKQPITISKEQLGGIGKIVGRNARLTQPIYMREVEEKGQ